jgi:hypothetical protein
VHILAGGLIGIGRIDAADLGDAGEITLTRERGPFGVERGGGDLRAGGELLRERLGLLEGRGARDLAIAEGFADAEAVLLAEEIGRASCRERVLHTV